MKWFRMYVSLVDSIKVGTLSDAGFRAYVELMCLAGEKSDGGRTGVTASTINWRLRRDVTSAVTEVVTSKLVTVNDDGEYVVGDWDLRQMDSDTSAGRMRKMRAKTLKGKDIPDGDGESDVTNPKSDGAEENRLDKNKEPPLPPEGEKTQPVGLKAYIAALKLKRERFCTDYPALWSYADQVKLPADFIELAWLSFRQRHFGGSKRYRDWRATFLNAVKGNWAKLWFLTAEGGYQLTTQGKQAKLEFAERSA